MKKLSTSLLLSVLVLIGLVSCKNRNQFFVDYTDLNSDINPEWFVPSRIGSVEMESELPDNCYMPGGEQVNDYLNAHEAELSEVVASAPERGHTTSSVPLVSFLQNLLSYGNQSKLIEIAGTYNSFYINPKTQEWEDIVLSGKILLPADKKIKRYILVSHYTIGSDRECPSRAFPLEGVLVKLGYCVIAPDYMGYGVTRDRLHPYLMMDQTALNVADMFYAARHYLEAHGIRPEHDDIFLMGYSQGGANTMAVERWIEEGMYSALHELEEIKIRRVFAGGGPYDVMNTYDRFVTTNLSGYPVAVPLVLQGMVVGAGLDVDLKDIMQPRIYENYNEWLNGKELTTSQINTLIGTTQTDEILTPLGMNQTSEPVAKLYKAMSENSVINMGWTPEAPVYMFHSMDDETVPYENATRAAARWSDANIQFNFGHYGKHQMGCIRFIFSVQTLLKNEK